MGSIWKTILTFAVIIVISALGITITLVNVDATTAGDYLEEIALVIRESNYNDGVIQQCVNEAVENGYILEVDIYENAEYADTCYAKLCLHYRYRLPILQIADWKQKEKII